MCVYLNSVCVWHQSKRIVIDKYTKSSSERPFKGKSFKSDLGSDGQTLSTFNPGCALREMNMDLLKTVNEGKTGVLEMG